MNISEFTLLLNKPGSVREKQTQLLERITQEFPYFQSARALYLKGLYNEDSFKYNQTLKTTAAYTTDRSVLFDFITGGNLTGLQHAFLEEKEARIKEIQVNGGEILQVEEKPQPKANTLEESILSSIKEAAPEEIQTETSIEPEIQTEEIVEKFEIGRPLDFSKEETHSFSEWLQLASFKPIEREVKSPEISEAEAEKQKKIDLIDRFIEANPKIQSIKDVTFTPIISGASEDTGYLMTETLARVYLEQKKYQKAIKAYEILILKYPEKSSLFADRISDIKILQQNNI